MQRTMYMLRGLDFLKAVGGFVTETEVEEWMRQGKLIALTDDDGELIVLASEDILEFIPPSARQVRVIGGDSG